MECFAKLEHGFCIVILSGTSCEVVISRPCPSAELGLSMATDTGERRLRALVDIRIDDCVCLPSWLLWGNNVISLVRLSSSSGSKFSGLPAVWVMLMIDEERSLGGRPGGI